MEALPLHLRVIKVAFLVLAVSCVLMGIGLWNRSRLPPVNRISGEMLREPSQIAVSEPSIEVRKNGHSYRIDPLFSYELYGLVVSQHDSSSWLDISHAEWQDYINTKDICVIWGENLKDENFRSLRYTSGNWTCYVETHSSEAWVRFKMNALSNNHVLPADEMVAKRIREAQIGDQIHLKGFLVNYSTDENPPRTTSITREDTGNHACEVVYVTEFETLDRYNGTWAKMLRIGWAGARLSFAVLLLMVFVAPFMAKRG